MKYLIFVFAVIMIPAISLSVPVDPDNPNGFAASYVWSESGGLHMIVLCTSGNIVRLQRGGMNTEYVWQLPDSHWPQDVPVPVSDILDWTPLSLTTHSGQLFMFSKDVDFQWHLVGADNHFPLLPCVPGPVESGEETWGGVKSQFR